MHQRCVLVGRIVVSEGRKVVSVGEISSLASISCRESSIPSEMMCEGVYIRRNVCKCVMNSRISHEIEKYRANECVFAREMGVLQGIVCTVA